MSEFRAKLISLLILAALLATLSLPPSVEAASSGLGIAARGDPAPLVVRASAEVGSRRIAAQRLLSRAGLQSTQVVIQYLENVRKDGYKYDCTPWPAEARAAFDYAGSLWSSWVNSPVPITIEACYTRMETGVLGSSQTDSHHRGFAHAPRADAWYPVALANARSGIDQDGSAPDMHLTYSSSFPWYFGLDGNTPTNRYDFVTIALHEIAHGLGFSGSMLVSGGLGYWDYSYFGDYDGFPFAYDYFVVNGSGRPLVTFPYGSAELAGQLTGGNLYFSGPNASAANGGAPPKLFAPAPWQQGSSYAHLDEVYNDGADSLMTYSARFGESVHHPGAITLGLLNDLGWIAPPVFSTLPALTVPAGLESDHILDLWAYAADNETPDEELIFTLNGAPVEAGVSLEAGRYLNLNPAPGWVGQFQIDLLATDSDGYAASAKLQVTVDRIKTWTGSLSSDWHTDGNWAPAGVPTSADAVVIPASSLGPVIAAAGASARDLTLQAGAVLELAGMGLAVEGAVSNAGTLVQTLEVFPGVKTEFLRLTNAAGAAAKYAGLELTPAGAAGEGGPAAQVTVSIAGGQFCPGRAGGVKRCFTITPSDLLQGSVRFYFREVERNAQTLASLRVFLESGGWSVIPGPVSFGGSGEALYVEALGLSRFAAFALEEDGRIFLPLVGLSAP